MGRTSSTPYMHAENAVVLPHDEGCTYHAHAEKAVVVPGLARGAGAPTALLPLLPG